MNHGMVKLSDVLGGKPFKFTSKMLATAPIKAPIPKPPRVVGDPTRTPVNRQAAQLLSRPSWLTEPLPPEAPKDRETEIIRLREANTQLSVAKERLAHQVSVLQRRVDRLTILLNRKTKSVSVVIPSVLTPPPVKSKLQLLAERLLP